MIIPYHSIYSSSLIITQVFHSPYYKDRAHVKCSLSRSDGDSNRFLTQVAPSSFSSTITNIAHGGWTPGPDSVQASRSEQLILPAKCGACIQHDKRHVNDLSLIDTGRGTAIRPCLVSNSFPHLVIFHHSNDS